MEKGKTFKLLDHGYIKFISSMGSDEEIIEAARMSTGRGFVSWDPYHRCSAPGCDTWRFVSEINLQPNDELKCHTHPDSKMEKFPNGDMGLLDMLWRNKHATPFECGGEIMIEVQAPIFVFREWHRHRTQSYNEFSARYAQMPNLHYLPEKSRIQKQSTTNKQGSEGSLAEEFPHYVERVLGQIQVQQEDIYVSYDQWVEEGLAKEVARINTPVSRYSKMRAKTDVRNWLAFLNLRMRPGAQYEIRVYANAMAEILKSLFPRTWQLFEEYDLYAASFGRTEMKVLKGIMHQFYSEVTRYEEEKAGIGACVKMAHIDSVIQKYAEAEAKDFNLSGSKLKEFMRKLEKGGLEIL
jgi:thymidylate synthase (FAD)